MYERILVALSREGHDEQLMSAAAAVAAPGSTVRVVHVRDVDEPREGARSLLIEAVAELTALGLAAEPEIHVASHASRKYAQLIAEAARAFNADLVMMGSRGLSDLTAVFRGSISHDTIAHLDVPVLVVRGADAARRLRRLAAGGLVLVAVDWTDRAMRLGGEVATAAPAAKVLVAHVVELIAAEAYAYVEPEDEVDALLEHTVKAIRAHGQRTSSVRLRSTRGVARAIADFAEHRDVDLVVMGSRRLGDLPGLILGSVSHEVVHLHQGPVLILARAASTLAGPEKATAQARS